MIGLSKCRACGRYFFMNEMTSDSEVADSLPQICSACDGTPISSEPFVRENVFAEAKNPKPFDLTREDVKALEAVNREAIKKRVKILNRVRNRETRKARDARKRGKKE